MTKYEGKRLNLLQYKSQYQIIDTDSTSKYYLKFIEFPTVLKVGKNSIRFIGNRDTLISGAEIYVEILDAESNALYYEVLNYIDSDNATTIVVYVPENIPAGNFIALFATTVGRDLNNNILDKVNIANYLWIGTGNIANTKNDSKILFTDIEPIIDIKEIMSNFNSIKNRNKTINISGSAGFYIVNSIDRLTNRNSLQKIENDLQLYQKSTVNRIFSSSAAGKLVDDKNYSTVYSSNFEFKSDMIGGTIIFRNININESLSTYSASIIDIVNYNEVKISPSFKLYDSIVSIPSFKLGRYEDKIYNRLDCTMSYYSNPPATASLKTQSSLFVNIKNLKPSVGVVDSLKLYYKPIGEIGDSYQEYGSIKLNNRNLLRDTSSLNISSSYNTGFIDIGNFQYSGSFSQHWIRFDNKNQSNSVQIIDDSSILMNALKLVSTVHTGSNDYFGFYLHKKYSVEVTKNTDYILSFDAVCKNYIQTPIISLYSTSSASWIGFKPSKIIPYTEYKLTNKDLTLGEFIGSVKASSGISKYNIKFNILNDSQLVPKLHFTPGEWYISNLQITSDAEYGISHTYELIPLHDKLKRDIEYEFYIKYANSIGQESKYATKTDGIIFDGGNTVIDGLDNTISGSIYAVNKLDAILFTDSNKSYLTNKRSGFVTFQASGSDLYGAAQLEVLVNEYVNTHSYDPGRPKSQHRLFYISGSEMYINNVQPAMTSSFDLRIQNNGKLVYAVSDENLKTDFSKLNLDIEEKILSLPIGKFKYKNDNNWNYGMLAQDVETYFPELVKSNNGIKTIDYNQLLSLLIYYIQTKFNKL